MIDKNKKQMNPETAFYDFEGLNNLSGQLHFIFLLALLRSALILIRK